MKKKSNKLTKSILETAKDMAELGILDKKTYKKITMRHMKKSKLPEIEEITPEEIRTLRESEHLSQSAFAYYLNLTVGYVSQLERGIKHPKGPALVLLDVIRRKGLRTIL